MTETATSNALFSPLHAKLRRAEGRVPAWVSSMRDAALARFEELGFPTPDQEAWRGTSVAPIARSTFRSAPETDVASETLAPYRLDAHEAVFVNGRFVPALSSLLTLAAGVEVTSLAQAIASSPDAVRRALGQVLTKDDNPFTALNTAFLADGAFIRLAVGAVAEKPIHLLFYSTNPGTGTTATHPRVLIVAEPGSQAKVVETYAGPEGHAYFTNSVTEIDLADGAVVEHYKMQRESEAAFHIGRIEARQAASSQLNSYSFAFGSALVRTDIDARLLGPGADCGLYGLYLGRGTQHVDHHTTIDHAVPRCSSRELYKGVLDDRSRGVFFGTILVRKDAQKTVAHQTNKNLLLSREALVNSTPRLQIEADDVKCKHGSTTGQMDPVALFYLRSRGIGEAEARSLLTYAFAADVVERINVPEVRRSLFTFLSTRLPGVGGVAEAS